MRIPVITINKPYPLEVTATVENNTKEYLSGKTVTGIALYIEQPACDGQGFLAMSLLIPDCGEIKLLKNDGFEENVMCDVIKKISGLREEIIEYINERKTT